MRISDGSSDVCSSDLDYGEVTGALAGHSPGMVRLDRQSRLVLSVAVPVQRYRQVLGALMLSKDGTEVDAAVDDRRRDILIVCGVAFAVPVQIGRASCGGRVCRTVVSLGGCEI